MSDKLIVSHPVVSLEFLAFYQSIVRITLFGDFDLLLVVLQILPILILN